MVVLSIGLLGMAALQAFSLKANQSANFRTQATALAYRIVDEMRGHGGGALNTAVAYYGSGNDSRAMGDLLAWQTAIQNQLPGGVGTLEFNGGNIEVHINWTDARWQISTSDQATEFVLRTTL